MLLQCYMSNQNHKHTAHIISNYSKYMNKLALDYKAYRMILTSHYHFAAMSC